MSEIFGPNFAEYIPLKKLDYEMVCLKRGYISSAKKLVPFFKLFLKSNKLILIQFILDTFS